MPFFPYTRKQISKIFLIPCLFFVSGFLCTAFIHSLFYISLESPPPSLLLLDRQLNYLAEMPTADEKYGYWRLTDTLPRRITTLTLAAEDHRFYSHPGVDAVAAVRAFWQNYIARAGYSGASTIAMQVARLQTPAARHWYAKVRESFTAVWLTLRYGKESVLRHYLTIAPYGNSIHGVNYAARRYFQKPLVDLSWAEAALVAALPKAPGDMNLFDKQGLRQAKKRAKVILERAHQHQWISDGEYSYSREELASLQLPAKERRHYSTLHAVLEMENYFHKRKKISNRIENDLNFSIQTSLDLNLQEKILDIVRERLPHLRQSGASNMAVLVTKTSTGEVLSYIGSGSYYDDHYAGSIDFVQVDRSTGSLLKPFIYGLGMEWNGYTAVTQLTDVGLNFTDANSVYIPENYDQKFLGPVLYKTALANSRNIPAIQVLKEVGVERTYQHLVELGLTPDDGKANYYGLGLAIGGLYTSLWQQCQAYLALANQGKETPQSWMANPDLKVTRSQVIRPDISLQLQRFLSDPLARLPTFPRGGFMEYPYPVGIKSGTSQGYRDAWTIGWSDTYLVGIWIGHHDHLPMKQVNGYEHAAPVVKEIFSLLHQDRKEGLDNHAFPPPSNYKPVNICRLSGKLADQNTPYTTVEYVKPGTEPTEYSDVLKLIAIDQGSGQLATPNCPSDRVIYKKFVFLKSIFKDWAISQGLNTPPLEYCSRCGSGRIVDHYQIQITSPLQNSRFYIDPEMPENASELSLNCMVEPRVSEVLWLINGKEYKIEDYPYKLNWPMQPGEFTFQAVVPFTDYKSQSIKVEIF